MDAASTMMGTGTGMGATRAQPTATMAANAAQTLAGLMTLEAASMADTKVRVGQVAMREGAGGHGAHDGSVSCSAGQRFAAGFVSWVCNPMGSNDRSAKGVMRCGPLCVYTGYGQRVAWRRGVPLLAPGSPSAVLWQRGPGHAHRPAAAQLRRRAGPPGGERGREGEEKSRRRVGGGQKKGVVVVKVWPREASAWLAGQLGTVHEHGRDLRCEVQGPAEGLEALL